MLKTRFFWIIVLVISGLASVNTLQAIDAFVEAKAAYFLPTDDKFRKIYSGGGIYGGEISCQAYKGLYGWASGSYFYKSGHSIGEHNATRITMVPLGLGLKYLYRISFADLYLGAGVLGTYVHMKDSSHYVVHEHSKWGVGGIIKGGAILNVNKHFFVDLFTDYSFMNVNFHNTHNGTVARHNADLSGWSIGTGIGYRFGGPSKGRKNSKKTSFAEPVSPIVVELTRSLDEKPMILNAEELITSNDEVPSGIEPAIPIEQYEIEIR